MREYIRHPSSIPIEYEIKGFADPKKEKLKNVSLGGLCFQSGNFMDNGLEVMICIPTIKPPFAADSVVVWCEKNDNHFNVGVQFNDKETEFRVRMVEQICHIEEYRNSILETGTRTLSLEEATFEWIDKYAKDFGH